MQREFEKQNRILHILIDEKHGRRLSFLVLLISFFTQINSFFALAFVFKDADFQNISLHSHIRQHEKSAFDWAQRVSIFSPFTHQSNPYQCTPQSLSFFQKHRKRNRHTNDSLILLHAKNDGESSSEQMKKEEEFDNSSKRQKPAKKRGKKNNDTKGNFITRFFSKKNSKPEKNVENTQQRKINIGLPNLRIPIDDESKIDTPLNEEINLELKNSESNNDPSSVLPNVFEVIGDNLKEVRNTISDIRPDSLLDNANDDTGLSNRSTDEETKLLKQLKMQIDKAKKEKALKDQQERDKKKKEALEKERKRALAKREKRMRAEEMKKKELKQRELMVRQKVIMEAARYQPGDNEKKIDDSSSNEEKKGTGMEKSSKGNFDPKSMLSGGLKNAQNFIGNTWDSVFGDEDDAEWIVACPKTRISPGEVVPIVAGGIDLLLVASKDAKKLHVIANSCPHLGTPLETGPIERRPIEAFEYGSANAFPPSNMATTPTKSGIASASSTQGKISNVGGGDGCEECIVCPLHQTAFALESGEVRGEWCPYPPVLGKVMGAVKPQAKLSTFGVRTRGKNIEIRLNTPLNKKEK